ncbi:DUF7666 domain-containing protein [Enterococcus olivae]
MKEQNSEVVRGYKVFDENWQCRGFQYEVGKTFTHGEQIEPCVSGFHFCPKVSDCFSYYSFDPRNKIAEVIAHGEVKGDDDKLVTDVIEIIREVSWEEMLRLANSGSNNSGHSNSGDFNSGDFNSGDFNSGDFNSGDFNSGHSNSGDFNSGHSNSGHSNSGDFNSGDFNSGHSNSGDFNSGDFNSGDFNSGHSNSGNFNSGNRNSGEWNVSDHNSGCFNTETRPLHFFDKETDITWADWYRHRGRYILNSFLYRPTSWVWHDDMTDDEKAQNPHWEVTRGYLKRNQLSYKEAFQEFWNKLDEGEKADVLTIPNFDAVKFEKITGVNVHG